MSGRKADAEDGEHNQVVLLTNRKSSFPLLIQLLSAFVSGLLLSTLVQPFSLLYPSTALEFQSNAPLLICSPELVPRAEPYAGSTVAQVFPPPSPTNKYPALFPTNVGYPGGTVTGTEAAAAATAPVYPSNPSPGSSGGQPQLVQPSTFAGQPASPGFDLLKSWGNLSPWYSIPRTAFGLDSSPSSPETCTVTALHLLHRHGARYSTAGSSFGSPAAFAGRLQNTSASWNATGDLQFLNSWTYKLGQEILTPFGRQQMYDLGVSMRMKYGFLLKNFTDANLLPVFRTESQDRMLKSALDFANGFFGYPFEDQYQQSITIEAPGFNNTLAPYYSCPNSGDPTKGSRGTWYLTTWADKYLQLALERLQAQMQGYHFSVEDMYGMQMLCAYETVALGFSKFCGLFSEEEWAGFDYALDLTFWYNSAYGSPVGRAQGVGYIQELVARLTSTPIAVHNSSTNSTLDDNPVTFPLGAGQSLYVDATHEVVVLNVLTALNLTNFASIGPLPADRIPDNRSFKASQLAPFGTNVQFQLLSCASPTQPTGPQIRIIVNDGVTPLTGINGCPEQPDGMCPLDVFVAAQRETIKEVDFAWDCKGNWTVPPGMGWSTTRGSPPSKP